MSRRKTAATVACLILLFVAASGLAQTVTGRIVGTVSDASGAAIPQVRIMALNEETSFERSDLTNQTGSYTLVNLPIGKYTISAELAGFKKAIKTGNTLVTDGRLTVDFVMQIGELTEWVEVTATAGEALNTVSGEISRVIDTRQVQDLALNGRNYVQLATLIPGSAVQDESQMDLTTSLATNTQAINGNRANFSSLTVDGGMNLDSGSNASQINNIGIDFIREVKVQTSNFSAEYGRNMGASINVLTRNGSNEFHGGVLEFFRNDKLDARNFFAATRSTLRYNDFGWNLGGPILKNKLFFFGGQETKKIRRQSDATRQTLPTTAELAGDFSGRSGNLYYPGTTTPIPGRNIASLMTADGKAIANVYNAMEKLANSYTDRPIGSNTVYQVPNPFDAREDIARLDYTINNQQNMYFRYIHDHYDLIDPFGTFSGSNLPTTPTHRKRPGYSFQLAHTWLLSPTVVNEAKMNASWSGQRIPPYGDTWKRSTYGFESPQLYGGGRYEEGIPNVTIVGFANFNGPSFSLLAPTTDISWIDNLTWIHGAHTLKGGVAIYRNRKDQNGRPAYTGQVAFDTNANPNTTGNALADALLGNFRTYQEASGDPIGFFRYTQYEAYVMDSWKVSRNLSFELGVRWQYGLPIYTLANNVVDFNPSLYNPANAVQITSSGTIVPGVGNRFNGLIRAGDGVPADQAGRVSAVGQPEMELVPTGAPRGLYDPESRFAPRFSFAWTPAVSTSVRGGFGIFYDRPQGNMIFSAVNIPPFLKISQYENGNLSNPSGGTASALAPLANIAAIDPNLRTPYSMNWSLSIQRELPSAFFLEAAYVGNGGRHLLRQPDINEITPEAYDANSKKPKSEQLAQAALRRYKGYSQIQMYLSDSTSNYHALQAYLTKRRGDLNMTLGYTWSKVLTDASGDGERSENYADRHYNYGPAAFDRRHVVVATYSYRLPFFRNTKGIARGAFGGWEFSGVTRLQTGEYFTVTGQTGTGARRADYIGGNVYLPSSERAAARWFNTAAFKAAPNGRRGNAGYNTLEGPGLQSWDMSLRKELSITERIAARLQVDLFNIFNIANFRLGAPQTVAPNNTNVSNGAYGTLAAAGPARNIQLGFKLNF